MNKLLFVFMVVSLAACQTTEPQVETVTEFIDRPVYCAEAPSKETYQTEKVQRDDGVYAKVEALVIEREQRANMETELRTIIEGCSKPDNEQQLSLRGLTKHLPLLAPPGAFLLCG